jgi:altronate dehydratase
MSVTQQGWAAFVIHPDDDVAVALRDLAAGETIGVRRGGATDSARVAEPIPLGHKLALRALARGAPIRKYGECIGEASADIAAGAHVHVHNLVSRRGRQQP